MDRKIWKFALVGLCAASWLTVCRSSIPPTPSTSPATLSSPPPAPSTSPATLISPSPVPSTSPATLISPSPAPSTSLATLISPTFLEISPTEQVTPFPLTPSPVASSPTKTALPPASSTSTSQPVGGLELHQLDPASLRLARETGAEWVRFNALQWPVIEAQHGQRNWQAAAGLEEGLKQAAEEGLRVILVVRGTPGWAQQTSGVSCGAVKRDNLDDFGDFLYEAVQRYSQAPYHVKYWELLNEPDIDPSLVAGDSAYGCWGEQGDRFYGGQEYGRMLNAVTPRIKAADPQAQVLVGGLLLDCNPDDPPEEPPGSGETKDCSPGRFLEGILQNGGSSFDGVSFHAYDYYLGKVGQYSSPGWKSSWDTTGPALAAKAQFLRGLLTRYGWTDKELFNTESALICTGNAATCTSEIFEQTKAEYATQANATALAEGLSANIWYSLAGWRGSGVVDRNQEPLPVFTALQFSNAMLSGLSYSRPIDEPAGVRGFEFRDAGRRVWVLWAMDGSEHSLELAKLPAQQYDLYGRQSPASMQAIVGGTPLYLEWLE